MKPRVSSSPSAPGFTLRLCCGKRRSFRHPSSDEGTATCLIIAGILSLAFMGFADVSTEERLDHGVIGFPGSLRGSNHGVIGLPGSSRQENHGVIGLLRSSGSLDNTSCCTRS